MWYMNITVNVDKMSCAQSNFPLFAKFSSSAVNIICGKKLKLKIPLQRRGKSILLT